MLQDNLQFDQARHTKPGIQSAPRLRSGRLAGLWEQPMWAALFSFLIYSLFANITFTTPAFSQSGAPYFVYLADALLHGQIALRATPPNHLDLSVYHNQLYLYWGPFPAIVFLPFVALFGLATSDTFLTVVIGAFNVALVAWMLRYASVRGVARLSRQQRGLLTLFFAVGTVHFTLAPHASVWFTGQVVGLMCVLLTYVVAFALRGWPAFMLCGMSIAGALLTRNHMLFAGIWPAFYLLFRHRHEGRRLVGYAIAGLLPVVLGGAVLLVYNYLRFGSPFDNGLAYHRMGEFFVADYKQYGVFNWHYLPTNLFYQYINYPLPIRSDTPMGGSLFLLSPVFFAAIAAVVQYRRTMHMWFLVASIAVVSIPILLLMGTGWQQFGPRYTLDFHAPLLLLTALGIRRWRIPIVRQLIVISIAHYTIGAYIIG